MPTAVLRRVVSPILAVTPSASVHGFVTVPKGTIIETPDGLVEPGLVSIKLGEQELLVFKRDIEERCEPFWDGESDEPDGAGARPPGAANRGREG